MGKMEAKYLDYCRMIGLSKDTLEAKSYDLKFFDWQKIKSVNDIYYFAEKQRPTSAGRFRMIINLKMFYKWLSENYGSPIDYNKIKIPRRVDPPQPYVTEKEFLLMDDECHKLMSDTRWDKAHIVLHILWETGIRRGELRSIEINNLDNDHRTFLVVNEKTHHTKRCFYQIDLSEYLRRFKPQKEVFKISKRQLNYYIEVLREKAHIEKKITCHSFRHGFCTRILNNGMDIQTTATLLGHQKLSTTMRYWHTSEPELRSKYNQFMNAPKSYEFSTKVGRQTNYQIELRITKNKSSGRG